MKSKDYCGDYPLNENRPELIRSLTGKSLAEITLEAIVEGSVTEQDLCISPETLELQAKIAEQEGRRALAGNFRRAAELCRVPDAKVLQIYEALRPNRSSKEDLEGMADDLEQNYAALLNADLIRTAVKAYEERNLLKKTSSG